MSDTLPLAATLAAAHPEDAAGLLIEFSAEENASFLTILDDATAASLLTAMPPALGAECLAVMPPKPAVARLTLMPPRAAATLLRSMSDEARSALLSGLSRTRQFQVGLVLRQPSQTVGAWMDTAVHPVPSDALMSAIRSMLARDTPVPTHLFVVDNDRRLIGSLAVSAVLAAEDEERVDEICTLGGPSLRANAGLETAIADPGWQDHDELPVVDHADQLVGAVRFAVLRQALAESRPDERLIAPTRTGSIMDIANLCYIGMARVLDASIARRRFDPPPREKDLS